MDYQYPDIRSLSQQASKRQHNYLLGRCQQDKQTDKTLGQRRKVLLVLCTKKVKAKYTENKKGEPWVIPSQYSRVSIFSCDYSCGTFWCIR